MKIFTGVGSRETPQEILHIMRKVSKKLVLQGWTLRSGGADGADFAFACGWGDAKEIEDSVPAAEIYIPWNGYNGLYSGVENCILVSVPDVQKAAQKLIGLVHPAFDKLSSGALALHTRNAYQVLGGSLDLRSSMLLCWSKLDQHGEPTGGTRTAIKIAEQYAIPVRNLSLDSDLAKVLEWLDAK